MSIQQSQISFQEAQKYIPGGVNSPVRAFKSVGGVPIFMQSAQGAYLKDVDGNEYIDYINSWGPAILGHALDFVQKAVNEQVEKGFSFGTPTELETEIAKLIVENVPSIDQIRMVNSGTEACMSALRLARGFTSRNKFIKFEGCYHGHADPFLVKAGSGAATFGNPSSAGVPVGTVEDTLVATFNDIDSVKKIFEEHKENLAAVILEPIAGNMGCIPPTTGFLQELRELCTHNDTLLILDEVMTGFRVAFGGAQELLGIQADILCYGKVIGGGMPVGAFAARNEIMNFLAPNGPVYQAGTLSGNPIAMQAGYSTLNYLLENPSIYSQLESTTEFLKTEISSILNEKGIEFQLNAMNSMLSIFFTDKKVENFQDVAQSNHEQFNEFFHEMLRNGVYLPPSSYETWFISSKIQTKELDKTLEAIRKSL